MKFIKKIKNIISIIISRTKTYKVVIAENNHLLDLLVQKDRIISSLEDNTKYYNELSNRRDEFIRRITGKIPDNVIGGNFENYKFWLAQPFIEVDFDRYIEPDDVSVFIDTHSAIKMITKAKEMFDDKKG